MYRGTSLVERGDIVYVSIQYRLGALGYLDFSEYSTAERSFETNLGLRDQIAAMTWVQRNIAAFRSEEHTSALQSLMRISYAVFCLKKKNTQQSHQRKPTR